MKIGFFDSGLGGITVLNEALKENIKAEYIYLADNKNTPYGIKDKNEVKKYVFQNIEFLVKNGCKIIVIACNTATALCIKELRKKYQNICFIGTEPAVKVAADDKERKNILVTATTITLKEEKLKNLITNLHINDIVELLPLDKLVEFAENNIHDERVDKYIQEKLSKYDLNKFSHIVLGCTHFPLFKENFERLFPNVKVIDGSKGIINNLKRKIKDINLEDKNDKLFLALTKRDDNFIDNFNNISKKKINQITIKYLTRIHKLYFNRKKNKKKSLIN